MYVRRVVLANFRGYRGLDLALPAGSVLVVGDNAQGKSTLLEALYVLATTRSAYAGSDRELIHWDAAREALPFSRVSGEVVRATGVEVIEVVNVRQAGGPGDERFTKQVRLNGSLRRAMDVLGRLNVVLFTPRNLELIHGGPAERRRYLDVLLCQVDGAYCRALASYNRVLAQRNALLRRLRERRGERAELAFWDDRLAEDGGLVLARRAAATALLAELAEGVHTELAGDGRLVVDYRPALVAGAPLGGSQPAFQAALLADLAARLDDELARGVTLSGPHRDDLSFRVAGVDMRTYGSRGQQRTVTLALKLAEAGLMRAETGELPVLLLDDVLSELDERRQACVLDHVNAHQQTLITTTHAEAPVLGRLRAPLMLRVAAAQVWRGAAPPA